jgi:hypothetical protein
MKTKKEGKEKLINEWRETYKRFNEDSRLENADYESLCVGWCVAKGLTIKEAFSFYQKMIPLNLF